MVTATSVLPTIHYLFGLGKEDILSNNAVFHV